MLSLVTLIFNPCSSRVWSACPWGQPLLFSREQGLQVKSVLNQICFLKSIRYTIFNPTQWVASPSELYFIHLFVCLFIYLSHHCWASHMAIKTLPPVQTTRTEWLTFLMFIISGIYLLIILSFSLFCIPRISSFLSAYVPEVFSCHCYVIHGWFCGFLSLCEHLWRKQWHPTPVFLPGKSRGWRTQ